MVPGRKRLGRDGGEEGGDGGRRGGRWREEGEEMEGGGRLGEGMEGEVGLVVVSYYI